MYEFVDSTEDNSKIGYALRTAHSEWAKTTGGPSRPIRLPSSAQIKFVNVGSNVRMVMSGPATSENMQDNVAAFEGWALALRLWLQYDGIALHWTPPSRTAGQPLNPHYARFLYRVQRFSELFPAWFSVGTPDHFSDCAVRSSDVLFLNNAGATSQEPNKPKRETEIERSLTAEHAHLLQGALNLELVDRQFPVGLYRSPELKNAVFTGGTSAIDIVGVGSSGDFAVIELKVGENIRVGALGELLFYAAVIRDAASGTFKFGNKKNKVSRSQIGSKEVCDTKKIRAILLAEKFHPLLEHPLLITTLNEAAKRQKESIPLAFEQWLLKDYGSENGPTFECVGT